MAQKQKPIHTLHGWLAANKNGQVNFYRYKPIRSRDKWIVTMCDPLPVDFPDINWDDEPKKAYICVYSVSVAE